jgi:hypothetical protein
VTQGRALATAAVFAVVALVVSMAVFARRDVTA